jgi:type I restriction enzyme S subunit
MTKNNNTLPQGWSSLPINEVFEFIGTSSFSRNDLNYEADENSIYNIHYGDIHATYKNAVLDFDTETRIPVLKDHIKSSTNFLKEGDLIIADASEDYEGVGEALEVYNIGEKKVLAGLHTFALRDKNNKTAHGYRAYLFKNPEVKKRLKTIATGSKVYGISKGNLEKFKITLPPLPEQQKIAKILATWDKAIALQEKLISNKKENKKAVMKKLLTGEVRFKGFSEGWKEVKFGDISIKKSSSLSANSIELLKGDYKVYGANGLLQCVDFYKEEEPYISIVKDGAGVGRTLMCDAKSSVLGTLDSIKPKKNIDLYFIFLLTKRINFFKYVIGSTIPHIYFKDYSLEKIKLPSYDEQVKISSLLFGIEKEINVLQIELIALQKQKQGLMQHLLTGKIRVKN